MSLALSIADDFATIVDNLTPVTVAGQSVTAALRRAISTKEVAASGGKYVSSDTVFHLDRAEHTNQPEIGAAIADADGSWTILEAAWETFANRWRCVCRKLAIVGGSTVTIQRATYAKSTTGATEPTWSNVATGVLAKVQIESADIEDDRSNRTVRQSAFVYFASNQNLHPADRIISDSMTLKVLSWDGLSALDSLFRATCEVSKWPQS